MRRGWHHLHLNLLHDFLFQYQNKNFRSQILLGPQLIRFLYLSSQQGHWYLLKCNVMFNVNWNGSTYFLWGRIKNYDIYSIFSIDRYWWSWFPWLHHHYKTQCLKKVDLWNDEFHELLLVRTEKQRNKMDIDPLPQKQTRLRTYENWKIVLNIVTWICTIGKTLWQ